VHQNAGLTIVMGNFYAKVETDWRTWNGVIRKFEFGTENTRGEMRLNSNTFINKRHDNRTSMT